MLRRMALVVFLLSIASAALTGCGATPSAPAERDLKMAPMSMMPEAVQSAAAVTQQAYQFAVANPDVIWAGAGSTLYLLLPLIPDFALARDRLDEQRLEFLDHHGTSRDLRTFARIDDALRFDARVRRALREDEKKRGGLESPPRVCVCMASLDSHVYYRDSRLLSHPMKPVPMAARTIAPGAGTTGSTGGWSCSNQSHR